MLNRKQISSVTLCDPKNNIIVVVVEHPGWWETTRTNGNVKQSNYFPLNGLNGRTLQEEVRYQMMAYVHRKVHSGFVVR